MPPAKQIQVVVRKMRPRGPPPPPPIARKAGQRMGLTHDQILAAAKRTLKSRPGSVSIKAVAADLGVAHNSISGRLRRERTTLERELAKELLAKISRPMLPHEDWRSRLHDLFQDASDECRAHPGLAQAVIGWLGQSPRLSVDFTEQMLHLLAFAELSPPVAETTLDVLVAALCGGLAVQCPIFGGDAAAWAESVAKEMERVPANRYPLTYRSRAGLSLMASKKASTAVLEEAAPRASGLHDMAQVVITYIGSLRPRPARH